MDAFPNECIYEILIFLNPKYLQLCAQINNNFKKLCQNDNPLKLIPKKIMKLTSLSLRLKGKHRFFASNCMGMRINLSARGVID